VISVPRRRDPRLALAAAAFVACAWNNQGPSTRRYEELSARAEGHPLLQAWLPVAFAYRRSADEELYFATANAIRGAPYDRELLLAKRGEAPAGFRRSPAADGGWHWPYAEVPLEYPALVLPFIGLPAALASTFDGFAVGFGVLMAALVLAAAALAIRADRGATQADRAAGWWLAAGHFLAQGGLLVQRIDAVPTLFLALALWGAVRRRPLVLGLGVALAAAAKIVPLLVLLPLVAADRTSFGSRKAVARLVGGLALGLAAGFLPMIALSPGAFVSFVEYHRARGLHVESTYGAVLSLVEVVAGHPRGSALSFGSFNVPGATADALASASTPILVLSVVALALWLARIAPASTDALRRDRLACAGLAAIACIWLFGKVFSPQYLTWAIPFAVVAADRRIAALLIAAMAISQTYLRGFYDAVTDMRPLGVAALEVRLVILVAMTVLALKALAGHEQTLEKG